MRGGERGEWEGDTKEIPGIWKKKTKIVNLLSNQVEFTNKNTTEMKKDI